MKFSNALFIATILAGTLWTINSRAAESNAAAENSPRSSVKPNVDVTIMTGVHSFPQIGMFGFLPVPASGAVSVDVNRLRVRLDLGHHVAGLSHMSLGGGILLTPYGKQAAHKGGFQIKIPVMLEAGVIAGSVEAHDGFNDDVKWLVAGPCVGTDFTWWKADRLGFNVSVKAGYMFRADIGSDFPDGYSYTDDEIGTLDLSLMLGVSI